MLKKTITFKNYYGEDITRDFWFNLNESELTEMNLMEDGGLERLISKIIDTHDQRRLIEYFKKIVLDSYGEISDDGLRFIKSPELSTAFSQTDAYNKLYMELVTDADKAAEFINGIVPPEVAKRAKDVQAAGNTNMNPALQSIQGKQIPLAIPKDESGNAN